VRYRNGNERYTRNRNVEMEGLFRSTHPTA
jgi:hypothetical protein